MNKKKRYLGDGLYVDFDGYHIVLTTENGISTTNKVCLDSAVMAAFLNYVEDLKNHEI